MLKSKNKFTVIAVLLIFALVISILFNNCANISKKHFLNVVTETRGSWISSGEKHYYTVYNNGKTEEIGKFEISETETYNLYEIEEKLKSGSTDAGNIPIHSKEIIQAIGAMEDCLADKYFVVDNRYFFSTSASKIPAKKYASSLYEYFPNDNALKKIADFQETYIISIELLSR